MTEENKENEYIEYIEEICPVCLDFQNCDSIIMECCKKLIHSYCLAQWLSIRNNCPHCRTQQSVYYNNLSNNFDNNNQDSFTNIMSVLRNINTELGITSRRFQRRRGFYISNMLPPDISITAPPSAHQQNVERGFPDFYLPLPWLGRNIFNLPRSINRLGITQLNNIYEIDNGITMYQNNDITGISYSNQNPELGISSLNIQANDHNISINLNGDININLNIDDTNEFQTVISNLLNDLTNEIFRFN